MDGLVSTGKTFPITILKIIFTTKKKIRLIFIHIFIVLLVDITCAFQNGLQKIQNGNACLSLLLRGANTICRYDADVYSKILLNGPIVFNLL